MSSNNIKQLNVLYKNQTTLDSYIYCVLAPKIAAELIRVTLGFHAEADFMISCLPHSFFLKLPSLSHKITVADFAHSAFGEPCPYPVYVDDEGVACKDVYIVDKGRIGACMTDKTTAASLGLPLTGNARIPKSERKPTICMRNTALLPNHDTLDNMISTIPNGFYFVDGFNFEGETNGDFACLIAEAYHIKNGKVCEKACNNVIWGSGRDFLRSITMVGNDFMWFPSTSGKKDLPKSSVGAPSIKAMVNTGRI